MKLGDQLDETDRKILLELQEDCKAPLAHVGKRVGLSAPSVMERIRKLEEADIIRGYHAVLNSRKVGLDVTAFIGVSLSPTGIEQLEAQVPDFDEVLESHHVTGAYTMLLKVKTQNTETLEQLISRVRRIEGVTRTETLVVLSTKLERTFVPIGVPSEREPRDPPVTKRANGAREQTREGASRENGTREHKFSSESETLRTTQQRSE
jgi:Lrp/AsnC family transcriptional regulator, leucine-responsive regulatory protein